MRDFILRFGYPPHSYAVIAILMISAAIPVLTALTVNINTDFGSLILAVIVILSGTISAIMYHLIFGFLIMFNLDKIEVQRTRMLELLQDELCCHNHER